MALRKSLTLRKPPTGPRAARPEDRLRGGLEGRTALVEPISKAKVPSDMRDVGARFRGHDEEVRGCRALEVHH